MSLRRIVYIPNRIYSMNCEENEEVEEKKEKDCPFNALRECLSMSRALDNGLFSFFSIQFYFIIILFLLFFLLSSAIQSLSLQRTETVLFFQHTEKNILIIIMY